MNRLIYKFDFKERVKSEDIDDSLTLAALAAEALHGQSAIKNDVFFRFDKKHRICVIDAESAVGCDIARILSTFITKGYGESAFCVERTMECSGSRRLLYAIGAVL